jgi:peptide/nickel transport system substrate-binding protein
MKSLRFLLPVLVLAAILALTACSTTSTPASTPANTTTVAQTTAAPAKTSAAPTTIAAGPKTGGVLKEVEALAPGTPIGWPAETAGNTATTAQLCIDLLLHEDLTGDLRPALAASWEVNTAPAAPSVIFKLRQGVKFHDGTEFNAEAVKWVFEQARTGVNVSATRPWKSFEVLDNYTLKINFTEWQNYLMRSFGAVSTLIVSPTAFQKNGVEWMRTHMVGAGPFVQTDYQRDVTLKATRYKEYWGTGKPYLDGVEINYVADQLTRMALFKTGGGDVMAVIPQDAAELKAAGYPILSAPGGAQMLIPDSLTADSPWANMKVRMAVEYAIDKESLNSAFGYGFTQAAYQIAPPSSKAYIANIQGRKYDLAKAKQLMTEAGFPNGFKSTLIATMASQKDTLVTIQAMLAKIGIQTEVQIPDAAKIAQIQTGTWSNALVYAGLINYANFNAVLNNWLAPVPTFYKSLKKPDGYEALYKASMASATADPVLMQKIVQAFSDDCTVIPTTYTASLWATQNYVRDTGWGTRGSTTQWNQENAWLDK